MTNLGKIIAVVVGVVLLVGGFVIGRSSLPELAFGAIGTNPVENYIPIIKYNEGYYSELPVQTTSTVTSNGITVGSSGTAITQIQKGTCSLIAPSFTVAASTTVAMDCAVSGVVSTDTIFGQFATSSSAGNGWIVNGVSASSTAGFATFRVTNWTGTSNVIPASVASSTKYFVFR